MQLMNLHDSLNKKDKYAYVFHSETKSDSRSGTKKKGPHEFINETCQLYKILLYQHLYT